MSRYEISGYYGGRPVTVTVGDDGTVDGDLVVLEAARALARRRAEISPGVTLPPVRASLTSEPGRFVTLRAVIDEPAVTGRRPRIAPAPKPPADAVV